jgi:hypothetical protein
MYNLQQVTIFSHFEYLTNAYTPCGRIYILSQAASERSAVRPS